MKEEKILFQVTRLEDGASAVSVHTETEEDLFAIALAMHQLISSNQTICELVEMCALMSTDKDFKKQLNLHTIEIPDFNKILKENK